MANSTADSAGTPFSDRERIAYRRYCLLALYVLAAFWGVAQIVSPTNGLIYFVTTILFASVATLWAIEDSRIRGVHIVRILQVLFFFTWPIASLIYLLATRQWRGLGWWLLNAMGLFAVMCGTFYPTFILCSRMASIDVGDSQ